MFSSLKSFNLFTQPGWVEGVYYSARGGGGPWRGSSHFCWSALCHLSHTFTRNTEDDPGSKSSGWWDTEGKNLAHSTASDCTAISYNIKNTYWCIDPPHDKGPLWYLALWDWPCGVGCLFFPLLHPINFGWDLDLGSENQIKALGALSSSSSHFCMVQGICGLAGLILQGT